MRPITLLNAASRGISMLAGLTLFTQVAVAQDGSVDSGALLDKYCTECHNPIDYAGGVDLESTSAAAMADTPDMGEKVIKRLRVGMMPPVGKDRPPYDVVQKLAQSLEQSIDKRAATKGPHLPAPGLHRLNRTEYTNAIRDLLALNIDAARFLPSDDSSHGFDNMAGTLTTSPALMEAYLSAAGKISRLAIGTETAPTLAVFDAPHDTCQNDYVEGLPFGTRGGMLIEHEFPADGEYTFTVKGMTGYFTAVLGNVKGEQLEVTVDGKRVYLYDWDKEIATKRGDGGKTPPMPIKAGFHRIGVTFLATSDLPDTGLNKSFQRTMNSPGSISGYTFYPHVGQVFIEGPFNGAVATDTQSRDKIFECYPKRASEEAGCARKIITTLTTKAFRRPASDADLKVMTDFYRSGREQGGSFDTGIEAVIQRILTDPEFIYRAEIEPAQVAAGTAYRISDLELASRLSFFLWSSIPDLELIKLASANKLHEPAVLEAAGRSHDRRSAFAGAGPELHRPVAEHPRHRCQRAGREPVPGFRQHAARCLQARNRAVLRQHHPGRPQRRRSADGGLHLRQRAPGQALRHPRHLRPAVPPRQAGARPGHAQGPAGQGRAADGHVRCGAHVAGEARQVVPPDLLRRKPAGSAAWRRNRTRPEAR